MAAAAARARVPASGRRPGEHTTLLLQCGLLHSTVDTYLGHLLDVHVPAEKVASYSFHSFRIGFACALLAAGCPYDMIQALARWRSDKIVAIYARLNPGDYTAWVAKALLQETTSTTRTRLPIIDAREAVATFKAA